MRRALVRLFVGPVGVAQMAQRLRDAGAEVTVEGTEHVHLILDLDPSGWGILPALQRLEDQVAADMGRPAGSILLGHATVLREVTP